MTKKFKFPKHPPKRGQQIKLKELARLAQVIERNDRVAIHTGLGIGIQNVHGAAGNSIRNNLYVPFWAKLTGKDTSTPKKYSFTEQVDTATDGTLIAKPSAPRQGTTTDYPGYSANGLDHQVGTVVLMWLGAGGDHYLFVDPALHIVDDQAIVIANQLNGAINASVTSLAVDAASYFPTANNYVITIESEKLLVTAGYGTTTWTVVRGWDGTTAASHADNTAVTLTAPDFVKGVNKITFDRRAFVYPGTVDQTGPGGVQEAIHLDTLQMVNITSATTTTIGAVPYYPAQRQYFNPVTDAITNVETIWATGINGELLTTGRYFGRLVGYAGVSGGNVYPIYLVSKTGGSSTGSPDIALTCKIPDITGQTVTAGATTALLSNDAEEWDTHAFFTTGTSTTRYVFATAGNGYYLVVYSTVADVTFAADLAPEQVQTFARLNGATEITASRDCKYIDRFSIVAGTATTVYAKSHACLGKAFLINVTDFANDYFELMGVATATLATVFDDVYVQIVKVNRAGAVAA